LNNITKATSDMSTLANNEEGLCFKADILQCGASTKQPCSSVTQDLENVQEFVQMSSCASGTTCCLPGYYGASSASCTACLLDKPSSPFSAPNSNCECPNSGSNKCFACNNKCRPYDSVSRMCVPVSCPSGQTCKVQSGAATCV